jgi:hypothetical protein
LKQLTPAQLIKFAPVIFRLGLAAFNAIMMSKNMTPDEAEKSANDDWFQADLESDLLIKLGH